MHYEYTDADPESVTIKIADYELIIPIGLVNIARTELNDIYSHWKTVNNEALDVRYDQVTNALRAAGWIQSYSGGGLETFILHDPTGDHNSIDYQPLDVIHVPYDPLPGWDKLMDVAKAKAGLS